MSWNTFKQNMFNNEIIKYQNLDFKGNNYLMTIDTIDNNFKPPFWIVTASISDSNNNTSMFGNLFAIKRSPQNVHNTKI